MVAFALAVMAVIGLLLVADPYAADSLLPGCLFHALTGLYCPGCGTTRALHALLHGEPMLAWRMNALTMLVLPFLPAMLWRSLRPSSGRAAWFLDARLWLVLVVAFTVFRNIPAEPFDWLAPASASVAMRPAPVTGPTAWDRECDGCRRDDSDVHKWDGRA